MRDNADKSLQDLHIGRIYKALVSKRYSVLVPVEKAEHPEYKYWMKSSGVNAFTPENEYFVLLQFIRAEELGFRGKYCVSLADIACTTTLVDDRSKFYAQIPTVLCGENIYIIDPYHIHLFGLKFRELLPIEELNG